MGDLSDRIEAALLAMPRERFLPSAERRRAGYDGPLQIGRGQTNSQPRTVVDMLELLDVRAGHRVLDVGAGSGWTTALLSHLAGPTGHVVGTEIEPDLVRFGNENLARLGVDARIEQALPDAFGLPPGAPYDRILVSADPGSLPDELVDQLDDDGVMVIPVAGRMLRVVGGARPRTTVHGYYRFVPLHLS